MMQTLTDPLRMASQSYTLLQMMFNALRNLNTLNTPATKCIVFPTEQTITSEPATVTFDFGSPRRWVDIQVFSTLGGGGPGSGAVFKFYDNTGSPINAIGIEIPAGGFRSLPLQVRSLKVWGAGGSTRVDIDGYL